MHVSHGTCKFCLGIRSGLIMTPCQTPTYRRRSVCVLPLFEVGLGHHHARCLVAYDIPFSDGFAISVSVIASRSEENSHVIVAMLRTSKAALSAWRGL